MIQSMTGYGKCVVEYNGKKIHADVKSLNSKALDITARIAPIYREKEMEMRQIMQQKLERGKVDFVLWIEKDEASSANPLNMALVRSYKQQIEQMQQELALPEPEDWYSTLLRLPDVFTHTEVEDRRRLTTSPLCSPLSNHTRRNVRRRSVSASSMPWNRTSAWTMTRTVSNRR